MNELQIFTHEQFGQIRTVMKDSEPWFVAADVCRALEISNPSMALDRLDPDEKMTLSSTDSHSGQRGGAQMMNIVNEPGLYTLVLGSRKKEAKAFKKWITHDVVPSIRKHGLYAVDEVLADPDILINALQALKKEREEKAALRQTVAIQSQQIMEMQPKASYYDLILQNKSTMPISQIAKDYGMSAKQMNKLLHEYGVQYKQGDIWLLYQKYAVQGYTQSRTYAVDADVSKLHTYWTQKGRLFLYDLLKSHDILPIIERN